MSTVCTEVSLENNPIEVLKGCSGLLSCLDESFADNIYNYQAVKVIADILTDAVSRIEDTKKDDLGSNEGIKATN